MGDTTGIAWTKRTFNAWWGCDEVSPGCDLCYARVWAARMGHDVWGQKAPRWYMGESYWRKPLAWNKAAETAKTPEPVFCMSMGDLFEHGPEPERGMMDMKRMELFRGLIPQTPWLTWQLLTKRPHNIPLMVPADWWLTGWPCNVWIGVSIENQALARVRLNRLFGLFSRDVQPPVIFFSVEPQLGLVDFAPWASIIADLQARGTTFWAIYGGESDVGAARQARPFDPGCIRFGIQQCRDLGTVPFVKQLGSAGARALSLQNKKGEDPAEWPADIRVREMPSLWMPAQEPR